MCEMNAFKTSISEIENGYAVFRNYGKRMITDIMVLHKNNQMENLSFLLKDKVNKLPGYAQTIQINTELKAEFVRSPPRKMQCNR